MAEVLLIVARNWPLPWQAICCRELRLWVEDRSAPHLVPLSGEQGFVQLNSWEILAWEILDGSSATWQPGLGYLVEPQTDLIRGLD